MSSEMRRRIENKLRIECTDVDLTKLSKIEFYITQGHTFLQYTPKVISESEMLVEIPFEDAMKLLASKVQLQFAFTDENGVPGASEIVELLVSNLLKEAGYDPV